LRSDFTELLPPDHPAVTALHRIAGRQKSSSNLVVIIESPDAAQNRRLADALRPELEKMIPSVFSEIQWRPETETPDFLSRYRWLYADLADLESAETLLDRVIARRTSPLAVDLQGDPEAELRALRERMNAAVPPRPTGDFAGESNGVHSLGLMLWRRGDGYASLGDQRTLDAVQEVVARVRPASFHPAMRVEYTGHVAMALDEQRAVKNDLTFSTLLCASLVLVVMYLHFRRAALIITVGAPALTGLFLALALARFTSGNLNSNTAFLLSIILGNGINSPIVLLSRYGEERRAGRDTIEALQHAMATTLLGTGTAMAAASVAYGSLLTTRLRCLSQFSLVGGAGMLFVWLAMFVVVPPLVILGERIRPGLTTPRTSLWNAPFRGFGRLVEKHPILLGAVSLLGVAAAVRPLRTYLADPIEWNTGKLRSAETGSQQRWGKMYQLGMGGVDAGYIGRDGVVLVDRPEDANAVAEALRQHDAAFGPRAVLREVRTIDSTLPKQQAEKLAVLGRIRAKIDKHAHLMDDQERGELTPWRPPDDLRAIGVPDLPTRVRENFTETDGTLGRMIGIDVALDRGIDFSDARDMVRIGRSLSADALGRRWTAASSTLVFAAIFQIMDEDRAQVTWTAIAGVLLVILIAFGLRSAPPVLASLAIGMVWLGGILAAIHLKLNFVNFVAVPITIGVGVDYGANIWARLRRGEAVAPTIAGTGSAVALCSMTTIIGYSTLLTARNRALQSFGLLADLGEIACLFAALLALPALARLVRRPR
jgi:predicted RND superfamily exporter protein